MSDKAIMPKHDHNFIECDRCEWLESRYEHVMRELQRLKDGKSGSVKEKPEEFSTEYVKVISGSRITLNEQIQEKFPVKDGSFLKIRVTKDQLIVEVAK